MPKLTRVASLYFNLVTLAGVVILLYLGPGHLVREWPGFLFFLVLTLIAEAFPVTLPQRDGTISASFACIYASIIISGPAVGAWTAALGTIRPKDLKRETPLRFVLFNRAQLALAAGLGGLVYVKLGGSVGEVQFLRDFPLLVVPGLVYSLANTGLVTLASSLGMRLPLRRVWYRNFRWGMVNYLALAPLGMLIGIVYDAVGPLAVVLLFLPLMLARYSFQRYMDMREVYLNTIKSLAAALDARDAYTYGHSNRVAHYAVKIGERMGLSERDLDLLTFVGILHDIGKIGIRDVVLNKPSKFTGAEYEEMKKHSEIGANIIQGIKLLGEGSDWIRYHHERYDGSGYPEGLKGEEIPLGARIIAVADALDAMTSNRPYKNAYGLDQVRKDFITHAGTQFDPHVVKVVLKIMEGMVLEVNEEYQCLVEATRKAEGQVAAGLDAGEKDQGG